LVDESFHIEPGISESHKILAKILLVVDLTDRFNFAKEMLEEG
jgi:hypothetical protein